MPGRTGGERGFSGQGEAIAEADREPFLLMEVTDDLLIRNP